LQAGGRRFESDRLHRVDRAGLVRYGPVGSAMAGRGGLLGPAADAVGRFEVFVRVNQVLVRLWARPLHV
jgi:hypothetical protein